MSNEHAEQELLRLENQAINIDAEIDGEAQTEAADVPGVDSAADFNAELADMLDMVALAGSAILPTVPTHFNHAQNERIAGAMILLADKYGYDLRANFLSQDSVVMLWLGLAVTVGVPARACLVDWKRLKEKEVKDAPPEAAAPGSEADAERTVTVG